MPKIEAINRQRHISRRMGDFSFIAAKAHIRYGRKQRNTVTAGKAAAKTFVRYLIIEVIGSSFYYLIFRLFVDTFSIFAV